MIGFDQDWAELGLSDDDLWTIQLMIQADPNRGPIVKGTGGLRKLRFAPPKKAGGENGIASGTSILPRRQLPCWWFAYAKNEADGLSPADKKVIRQLIEMQHKILSRRPVK